MLPGLQYTDFHKFLVSVGGLLSVVGLALPVFLLRNQPTLLIADHQLGQATPEAQQAVRSQQDQLAFLILSWPWISIGLIVVGLLLVALGARSWRKQQTRSDSREQAEISKLLAEGEKAHQETLALVSANQASPKELAEQDAERELAAESPADIALTSAPTQIASDSDISAAPITIINRRSSDNAVRRAIITSTERWFEGKGTAVPNVKLGGGRYATRALVSAVDYAPNLLLEIRYVDPSIPRRLSEAVQELAGWGIAAANSAHGMFKSQFIPVAVLAYELGEPQPTLPLMPETEMDDHQVEALVAKETRDFYNYPIPLVILLMNKRRIDVSPLAKITHLMPNGIHVL
ncbi:hypothetical protein [Plantactinospora sonchi]|uniref:Uncharacterized protein n=1 Tax=Plantactinospora sonchi TaxID=1544735 RepID=A0ABU7RWS2_9ACTN